MNGWCPDKGRVDDQYRCDVYPGLHPGLVCGTPLGGWRNCPFKARHVQSPDAGRRSAHSGQPTLKNRIAPGENGTLQKLCDECARTDGGQHGHAVDLSWRAGKRAPAPLFIASSFLFSLSFGYVKTGSICVASAGDSGTQPLFLPDGCVYFLDSHIWNQGPWLYIFVTPQLGGNCFHLPG